MLERYLDLNDETKKKFNLFYDLVVSSPVNLTAIKGKDEFALKHIYDSLYFFLKRSLKINTLADIGSGGGFPGLALAVYFSDWQITLIESIGKKCRFLENATQKLELANVRVINSRAENIPPSGYDIVTARGVGSVKELLKNTAHLVHDRGAWLIYKGERVNEELRDAKPILNKRGIKSELLRVETPFTRSYLHLYY
ncbi:MAG: 16S rRNA (guanine(527)-N(7))-methyltransferase RsmG [Deferribacteraceae bacterium]|jgi:16S rRNA (guanine527-N7)-methyltransferase|nr:16S rRNA (guanine(527)-N(7))-methyltransferase RsmG [Deferribacteraceae bacterium]